MLYVQKTVVGVLVTLGLLGCDQKTAFLECFEHRVEKATENNITLGTAEKLAAGRCKRGIITSDDLRLCTRVFGGSEGFSPEAYEFCNRN